MYFVYILSSTSRAIYVGVTNDLYDRVKQHKSGVNSNAFTKRYKITRLVYYETYKSIQRAIEREKQIKRWRRDKKVKLIESVNPEWRDLSREARFSAM
ncbi:MAG TPA: GIY-YIG nuclease family protein [Balneolaceae bacterium]|nr:GIY-YIG nuclease family protein [Balneolaceae bacterium]